MMRPGSPTTRASLEPIRQMVTEIQRGGGLRLANVDAVFEGQGGAAPVVFGGQVGALMHQGVVLGEVPSQLRPVGVFVEAPRLAVADGVVASATCPRTCCKKTSAWIRGRMSLVGQSRPQRRVYEEAILGSGECNIKQIGLAGGPLRWGACVDVAPQHHPGQALLLTLKGVDSADSLFAPFAEILGQWCVI